MLSGCANAAAHAGNWSTRKPSTRFGVAPLQSHLGRCQELDIDPHRHLVVPEVHGRDQLKVLLAFLVAAGVEQELQEICVTSLPEPGGIEGQVNVDAAAVFGRRAREQKVRHPATDDDHRVTEGREHLPDVDEHTTGRLDLAGRVVAFETRFWVHRMAPDHAGINRCRRIASAASSPRPPACARST